MQHNKICGLSHFYTAAFSVWLEKCADHPALTVIWLEFSPAEQVLIKINGKSYE